MAGAGDYFARNREEFKRNIVDYYEYVREQDLVLTHTLVNLQRNRAPVGTPWKTERTSRCPWSGDGRGIVVRGPACWPRWARWPMRSPCTPRGPHRLPGNALDRYAFAFAVPCGTPGLRFLCRESYDLGRSTFDHPLAPLRGDGCHRVLRRRAGALGAGPVRRHRPLQQSRPDHQPVHAFGHQVVTKNVAKCEFVVGLANLVVRTLGSGASPRRLLAELIEHLEVTKACCARREVTAAEVDQWGVMSGARPDYRRP